MIQPPPARAQVSDEGDHLRIAIPPPRKWYVALLLVAWIIVWAIALVVVARTLLAPASHGPRWFLAIWLALWVVGGGYAIHSALYMLFGLEVIRIDGTMLVVTRQARIYTRVQRFDVTQIRELRASPIANTIGWWGAAPNITDLSGFTGGHLAFDYGAKTYRFGAGVDEAEAKQLVARIVQRFPFLRSPVL